MNQVILDLGTDANVLPKKTWLQMGKPNLEWLDIQLRMANQQKIVTLGRLSQVVVDIVGVKVRADFEVIQIEEDTNPYLALLGLGWAMYMGGIIDLKKCNIVFEVKGTRVVISLDLAEGEQYIEPT